MQLPNVAHNTLIDLAKEATGRSGPRDLKDYTVPESRIGARARRELEKADAIRVIEDDSAVRIGFAMWVVNSYMNFKFEYR